MGACCLAAQGPSMTEGGCVEERVVTYAQPEEQPLRMSLFLPPGPAAAPRPAIVLIHGGAWIGGWRHQMHWFGRQFARAGLVAACIQYRKLPRYGFPECVQDGKAAVRWLRAHAAEVGVDPECILVSGHSAGGYIAMMVACTDAVPELDGSENLGHSSAIQGVISVYGAVDLRAYQQPGTSRLKRKAAEILFQRFLRRAAGDGEDPFEKSAPASYIHPGMCPALFIHGDQDGLVPMPVAQKFYESLTELNVPTKFVTFNGKHHAFEHVDFEARRQIFREIILFLQEQQLCAASVLATEEAVAPLAEMAPSSD
ncbi:MAG: alpha/beta hydrolase [Candidatus Hydrogenedentes bacterium]|nr:alpha/beta hydrolase [Candidatus Hydrogenedentota bacterium]